MAAFNITHTADNLTSGVFEDIKDQTFNFLNPTIVFACDDTYLTESTVGMLGNRLPAGTYQPVSQ